uniref:Uncharacterized protein LOC111114524 n=1 Tax=Crassostrea virginica TaxID=6565 RepID=A0A8B8BZ42_CRAVI|nr:uncharacterized protein LOC111114524 [Crassostrea virginica]
MASEEVILTTGVPDEFGKALRSDNGLYKGTSYEPTNKNDRYEIKKCSTPKPYKGHTYNHTINPRPQYREYEPRTYNRIYLMSKLHHDTPREVEEKPEEAPRESKSATPPRPVTPPLPYSAVETVKRSLLLLTASTQAPEQSHSVFS